MAAEEAEEVDREDRADHLEDLEDREVQAEVHPQLHHLDKEQEMYHQ